MWKVTEVEPDGTEFIVWIRDGRSNYKSVRATTAEDGIAKADAMLAELNALSKEAAAEADKVRSYYRIGFDPAEEQEAASAAADVSC